MVGAKEPEPCTRWAVSEEGWCWQHYVSETERVKREERIAIEKLAQDARIDEYLAWRDAHPSVWDSALTPPRKGRPFKLTELA